MSFPVRERGLKRKSAQKTLPAQRSFPVRERGLKLSHATCQDDWSWSFPVRERGLKPLREWTYCQHELVVPRAGTWIETQSVAAYFRVR